MGISKGTEALWMGMLIHGGTGLYSIAVIFAIGTFASYVIDIMDTSL